MDDLYEEEDELDALDDDICPGCGFAYEFCECEEVI